MSSRALIILGTRPEAIKMAPVYWKLMNCEGVKVEICSTGQHGDMLHDAMKFFDLPADYALEVMTPGQSLSKLTSKLLLGIETVINSVNPNCVFVHGDTTTAMAAAVSAFYAQVPVAHVEAGLRTHQLDSPFPEEFNRRIGGVLATWHFAPTKTNRDNLIYEGIDKNKIFVTGNTVIDALKMTLKKIDKDAALSSTIKTKLKIDLGFDPEKKNCVLVTCHRRENFGAGLEGICLALQNISRRHSDLEIIFPVHFNPNVSSVVQKRLKNIENIHLIRPLPYEVFCFLMGVAKFILTDSGGIQEEAPSIGKPVLVMRDTTERVEAVKAGTVRLVGSNPKNIQAAVDELVNTGFCFETGMLSENPYGDGAAADRIVEILGRDLRS
jgi:UDP-N-acetylglucosamine 2-epimerase (non-hydrolysing)